MFYAITVKDGIITGVHESVEPITGDTFQNSSVLAGQEVITLPEDNDAQQGENVAAYDANWRLKPLSQRVADGLVTVNEGYILDGKTIREMTHDEKVAAGLIEEPVQPVIDETAMQIAALKASLAESDYKITKCYEYSLAGLDMPYDIVALHAERQAIRGQINALKTQF